MVVTVVMLMVEVGEEGGDDYGDDEYGNDDEDSCSGDSYNDDDNRDNDGHDGDGDGDGDGGDGDSEVPTRGLNYGGSCSSPTWSRGQNVMCALSLLYY